MLRLEYIGKDTARRNWKRLLEHLRRMYPNVSETGIHEIAKAEFVRVAPRHDRLVQALFGRDILAADVTTIPAWPYLTPLMKRWVLNPALEGRTHETLMDPPGLSRTYVWSKKNNWLQEVTDEDAAIIRASPARTWFRDYDKHGPYTPARTWDLPVVARETFTDAAEARRFERDQKRKKSWTGA